LAAPDFIDQGIRFTASIPVDQSPRGAADRYRRPPRTDRHTTVGSTPAHAAAPNEHILLAALGDETRDITTLARMTNLSPRQLRYALGALADQGAIEVAGRQGRRLVYRRVTRRA
jgi:predicted Rossmann fold nucleotide-binding protein DprA/Smf involved in DNA uptake